MSTCVGAPFEREELASILSLRLKGRQIGKSFGSFVVDQEWLSGDPSLATATKQSVHGDFTIVRKW